MFGDASILQHTHLQFWTDSVLQRRRLINKRWKPVLAQGEKIRDSSCHALMASQFLPLHSAAAAAVISAKLPLCAPDQRFQKVNLPAEGLIETTISQTSPEEDNKD